MEDIDLSPGEEAGIRNATILIRGDYAFGYLKGETGNHRLIRISPFDSAGRRHTAFAAVDITPELDDDFEVEIDEADVRVDTFRASGAGGQHVNKTDSAIRLTHLPTGIVVECQDERSQHKNRAKAMSLLAARLQNAQQEAAAQNIADERRLLVGSGDRSERIRTYNYPQGRVTDHRINLTLYKLHEMMEGQLDDIIQPLVNEYQAEQLAALSS